MMGPKFKYGDRVVLNSKRPGNNMLKVGSTGTVIESGSTIPNVQWDNFTNGHWGLMGVLPAGVHRMDSGPVWAVVEECMSLVSEAPEKVQTHKRMKTMKVRSETKSVKTWSINFTPEEADRLAFVLGEISAKDRKLDRLIGKAYDAFSKIAIAEGLVGHQDLMTPDELYFD